MWSPLSRLLEGIAGIRFPFLRLRTALPVGRASVPDARGTSDWRRFLDARALSRVWGPHPHGPWVPFHCITLFAAIDYLKPEAVGPCASDPWPVRDFRPPDWIDSHTVLFVDLSGPKSAALGAALAIAGCDLVCTFNNWPHPKEVLHTEEILAALLRYASWLDLERTAYPTPAPAAWLCDAQRLGERKGKPGEFDNRYYIEDGLMPGPNYLRAQRVSKVVYVSDAADKINADLAGHIHAYAKDGFEVSHAVASDNGVLLDPTPLALTLPAFVATGFFRSSAGGFGAPVPHPSSGG